MTLRSSPVGSLTMPVKTWNPLREDPDDTFRYIDLSSVDQDTKSIVDVKMIRCGDAPSRARQIVENSDVLVSTVRPNLNGVAHVTPEFDLTTASTGFCVLRPDKRKIEPRYLMQWVKSPTFISDMVRKATGASYPAVSDRIICESVIPLPETIEEQRRIADILDRTEALRAKRRTALARLDELTQAIFVEMFGDPVSNPKGWPTVTLAQVGNLDRGISKHRPRNDPLLLGGTHPLIQTGEVSNCDGYIRSFNATYSDFGLKQSKLWPAGTLCITIAANIAKTGILTFDACFPDSIVGFTADEPATAEYVRVWLTFLQKTLEENAPESAQKNINLAILRDLKIPLPPIERQRAFSAALKASETLNMKHQLSDQSINALFASLQDRAFRGAL